ncbi:MAG: ROK family protein [Fidelibacterota bacterium]
MGQTFQAGIDLGGSKIYVLIRSDKGEIVATSRGPTPRGVSFEQIAAALKHHLDTALERSALTMADIDAVGLGVPGPVDAGGSVAVMPNLDLKNVPVGLTVEKILEKSVHVENDVNLAVLAEFHLGAGKGVSSLYGIVPGTGVGGGYVVDGKIVKGKNYTAGEIGHMVVKLDGPVCGCGQRGCLEALVGKVALVRELRAARERGEDSILMDSAGDDFLTVGAARLKEGWEKGDRLTRALLTEQARVLGVAVANVVNLTGVEGVVIGGRVFEAMGDVLLPKVKEMASRHAIGGGMEGVRLVVSALKEKGVALGATLLATLSAATEGPPPGDSS